MSNPLPSYLRALRRQSGLTQDELAFLLDCGGGSEICRLERARRAPSARTLAVTELILGAPMRQVFPAFCRPLEESLAERVAYFHRVLARRPRTSEVDRKIESLMEIAIRIDHARRR
jgi:transcriptional regulator with XRE-family HTH domain